MRQLERVERAMRDGEWHTLSALSERLRIGESCLSAHVRSLRKPRHGGYTVERTYDREDRVYLYRLANAKPLALDVEAVVQDVLYDVMAGVVFPNLKDLVREQARERMDSIFRAALR